MKLVQIELQVAWKEPPPEQEQKRQGAPRLSYMEMRPFATSGSLIIYGVDEGPGSSRNLLDQPLFAFDETPETMDAKWRYAREMEPQGDEGEEAQIGSTWLRTNLRVEQEFRSPHRKNALGRGWRWDSLVSPQGLAAVASLVASLAGAPSTTPPLTQKIRGLSINAGRLNGRDNREPAIKALEAFFERELPGVPFVGPWTAIEIAKEMLDRQNKAAMSTGIQLARTYPETLEYHAYIWGRVLAQAERLQMSEEIAARGESPAAAGALPGDAENLESPPPPGALTSSEPAAGKKKAQRI